jgi:hypothetical protein
MGNPGEDGEEAVTTDYAPRLRAELARGWMQGWDRPGGPACLVVACFRVADSGRRTRASSDIEHALVERFRAALGGESPLLWNDTPGRTLPDVLALIDRTDLRI